MSSGISMHLYKFSLKRWPFLKYFPLLFPVFPLPMTPSLAACEYPPEDPFDENALLDLKVSEGELKDGEWWEVWETDRMGVKDYEETWDEDGDAGGKGIRGLEGVFEDWRKLSNRVDLVGFKVSGWFCLFSFKGETATVKFLSSLTFFLLSSLTWALLFINSSPLLTPILISTLGTCSIALYMPITVFDLGI